MHAKKTLDQTKTSKIPDRYRLSSCKSITINTRWGFWNNSPSLAWAETLDARAGVQGAATRQPAADGVVAAEYHQPDTCEGVRILRLRRAKTDPASAPCARLAEQAAMLWGARGAPAEQITPTDGARPRKRRPATGGNARAAGNRHPNMPGGTEAVPARAERGPGRHLVAPGLGRLAGQMQRALCAGCKVGAASLLLAGLAAGLLLAGLAALLLLFALSAAPVLHDGRELLLAGRVDLLLAGAARIVFPGSLEVHRHALNPAACPGSPTRVPALLHWRIVQALRALTRFVTRDPPSPHPPPPVPTTSPARVPPLSDEVIGYDTQQYKDACANLQCVLSWPAPSLGGLQHFHMTLP